MDMFINLESFAENAGMLLDLIGIIAIVTGVILSSIYALTKLITDDNDGHSVYQLYRRSLARSILIGLEFLVAGDIIRSVAGDLNMDSVIILAIIIVMRSFLGVEFEMEIDSRWPWKRAEAEKRAKLLAPSKNTHDK